MERSLSDFGLQIVLSQKAPLCYEFAVSDRKPLICSTTVYLYALEKLPTPDLKAERTTSTSVNVRILFPKELNASYDAHSGYKVKIASEEPNSVTRFLFLNSTTMEVNITGLLPCKTYVIRLHAVGEHYLSKESRRLTVETRPNPSESYRVLAYFTLCLIKQVGTYNLPITAVDS